MAALSIGEVERLTGVKSHTLRYWEEIVPFLSPRKDTGGRRVYSARDVQVIMRLNFLIREKKYTVEGAREQLIREATDSASADTRNDIELLRNDLIGIYMIVSRRTGHGRRPGAAAADFEQDTAHAPQHT